MTAGTMESKRRPTRLLLVEDNPGDIILTKRAFKEARLENELTVASSGEEALKALRQEGPYASQPLPDLVLLDLNLPQMSGKDVLKEIKADPVLKSIPVVILSSSKAEQDVTHVYALHSNGYIAKPATLEGFKSMVQKVEAFWFTLNVFPEDEEAVP